MKVCGLNRSLRVHLEDGFWVHPHGDVCRVPQEVQEGETMIKEIRQVTCDRCREVVEQPTGTTGLPQGWKAAYLGAEPSDGSVTRPVYRHLCPECVPGAEEALRPLERVRTRRV